MSSYLLMMFILLFGGAILIGASLDFLGLGPTESISLGLMMNNAFLASRAAARRRGGGSCRRASASSRSSAALYVMNVGLDEVFNPKLRETVSLRVDDLTVYYRSLRGDVKAVDGATFEIADGEIMGLAGESGCGKSSLGKSLIRMDSRMRHVEGASSSTAVSFRSANDAKMNAFRFSDVSIVPAVLDERAQPDAEGRHGRAGAARVARRRASTRCCPELVRRLELVGLSEDVLDRFPIELSGGMKQRMVMVHLDRCSTRRC